MPVEQKEEEKEEQKEKIETENQETILEEESTHHEEESKADGHHSGADEDFDDTGEVALEEGLCCVGGYLHAAVEFVVEDSNGVEEYDEDVLEKVFGGRNEVVQVGSIGYACRSRDIRVHSRYLHTCFSRDEFRPTSCLNSALVLIS